MDPLSLPPTPSASSSAPSSAPKQRLATVNGPGLVRPRPAGPSGRSSRRESEDIDVQALAKQLGLNPADLRAAIQKVQAEQQGGGGAGGWQGDQDNALPWAAPSRQRQQSAVRTAQSLGVQAQGLQQAIDSVTDLPRGANPVQHAAQQLDVDPNALMTAMHQNGLTFVDEYA